MTAGATSLGHDVRVSELPDLPALLERVHVVTLPMRVRFRGVDVREAVLFEGPSGWGEFAPFVEYDDVESSRWLAAAIESAYAVWPAPRRETVPVNATVPAVPPSQVQEVFARFDGCTTAKVKVAEPGQDLADDLARVGEVRLALGPHGRVRVDANGAWDVETALDALTRLAAYDLEYAEQPCARVEDLADLRRRLARAGVDVPIAADESIRKADDPLRVAALDAADIIVVKVAPLGGVARALEIVSAAGLPAVVSSALDTSIGIAAGVALAAALPELDHACGLGTVSLFDRDVASAPLRPVAGVIPVRRAVADPALLAELAAPESRLAWWLDRLARCHAVLTGGAR